MRRPESSHQEGSGDNVFGGAGDPRSLRCEGRETMRVRSTLLVLATMAGAILPGLPSSAHTVRSATRLQGEKEVPGPGDPNGSGRARLRVNDEKNKLCYRITFRKVSSPTAVHVHRGSKDASGPVVVHITDGPDIKSPLTGCVNDVAEEALERIQRHPRRHYVNVHSEDFPDGAVRGQLRKVD